MRRLLVLAFALLAGPVFGQSHPSIMVGDSARVARWVQMRVDYEANTSSPATKGGQFYKYAKDSADTPTAYREGGMFSAWIYVVSCYYPTGTYSFAQCDSNYKDISYAYALTGNSGTHSGAGFLGRSSACTSAGVSGNWSRAFGTLLVIQYDWIYAGLTQPQRDTYLAQLNVMANCVGAGWAFGPNDTDQTTGDYFMFELLYRLTSSYNPTIVTYYGQTTRKHGNLTATASDNATARNAIKHYVDTFALDGEWMESDQYNPGTLDLLFGGAAAINSIVGGDSFPEITAFAQDVSYQFIHDVSPGINEATSQPNEWGDDEHPRVMESNVRYRLAALLTGLTRGTTAGPYITDWTYDWLESTNFITMQPYDYVVLAADWTTTRGDHTTLPLTRYASGQGLFSARTGWATADKWFNSHFTQNMRFAITGDYVDHAEERFGAFQLWDGACQCWAITYPRSYGGPTRDSRGSNGLSVRGVPAYLWGFREYKQVQAQETSTAGGFSYITGTAGGSIVKSQFFNMPPTFVEEYGRSVVWLPDFDTVIVHDRTNIKSAPTTTGYNAALKTWMDSRPRKELYVHSPVSPTQGSGYLEWQYTTGKQTRVTHLLPTSINRTVESEATVWNGTYYGVGTIQASEKKYHTIITPTVDQQWDTFLNVWNAHTGTPATVTLVQDAVNKVDCALVTKGADNRLACFNAVQGPDVPDRTLAGGFGTYTAGVSAVLDAVRKRTTSYTVTFTVPGGSSTTKALLFDLDTTKTWTYTVNGSGGTLTPDSKGVGIVDVSGTGSKTLVVTTTGIADLLITTTSPLPNGTQNVAYSTCLVATGGLQPFTWSKTGSLPAGLSLGAATGCITGTPSGTGASSFSVTVTDSQGVPDTATLNPTALTIDAAATPTVISTTSISEPTVDAVYSATITVTGGTGVYTCSKSAGQTPTGLTVNSNCTITGTATIADESASFTVQACDNAGSPSCDTQVYSQRVQFTNNTAMQLQIVGYADDVVYGYYGAPGLASNTSCTISMAGQADQTTTSGGSRRTFLFTGLNASTSYGITATCVGVAFQVQATVVTRASTGATTSNHKYSFRPTAALVAQGVAKMEFYASSTTGGLATAISIRAFGDRVACTTGCTVTGSVPQGLFYYRRLWTNSSDTIVLTGPIEFSVVP